MDRPTVVTRTVNLDIDPSELWWLLTDPDGWAGWLVDASNVAVEPGGTGTVTDGGTERDVRVAEVVEGERLTFDWWPAGDQGDASTVELHVEPNDAGVALRIVETFPSPRRVEAIQAVAEASVAWGIRATCLWACSRALVAA
jgi:uncharacterized protein YndB with AHSA1/START domain